MQRTLIFTLIFSVLVAVFAVMNSSAISINLLFTNVESYVSVVILISATLGAIIAYTFNGFGKFKLKKEIKELKNKMKKLENEKTELENAVKVETEKLDIVEKNEQDVKDENITQ